MTLVGIVEDQPLMAEAMTSALTQPQLDVRFTAASCEGLLDVFESHPVEVLVLDLPLRATDQVEALALVETLQVQVLLLSREVSPECARLALGHRVVDVLCTTGLGRKELVESVHAAARGEKRVDVDLIAEQGGLRAAPPVYRRAELAALTAREREILQLVGIGADNLKIGATLGITERTVKAHVSALYRKLHLENRVELALAALRLGPSRVVQPRIEG